MFDDIQNTILMKQDTTGWYVDGEFFNANSPRVAISVYMEFYNIYGTRSFKDVESGTLYIAYLNADYRTEVIELFVN